MNGLDAIAWQSIANQPPISDAGSDQTVTVGETVQLDGSGSSDPDGDPITFDWQIITRPGGSLADLSDAFAVNPTFMGDVIGDYVVRLVANDGVADSDPDDVTITVQTPAEATQDLVDDVADLVTASILNNGQGNALSAKLEAALQQLENGNTTAALNQLQAFINQVNALINAGTLSQPEGQPLIDAAQTIINALTA